ncbi:helix-turn-helix domain-containing protein [Acidisoma sp. 7E03]
MTDLEKGSLNSSDREASAIDLAVGSRLRKKRRELEWTGVQLSERLGVSSMQISKYEHGKHRIPAARLYEIASIFGVPIAYFFQDLPPCSQTELEPSASPTVADAQVKPVEPPGIAAAEQSVPPELEDLITLGRLAARIDDPKEKALIRRLLQRLPIFQGAADDEEGKPDDPS